MTTDERLSTGDLAAPRTEEVRTEPAEAPREIPTADAPAAPHGSEATPNGGAGWEPLLPEDDAARFRERWTAIQTGFVDEPREVVRDADALVAELMQRLAQGFADERSGLEAQWDREEEVDTEDMRLALQRYRSFFERLLAA